MCVYPLVQVNCVRVPTLGDRKCGCGVYVRGVVWCVRGGCVWCVCVCGGGLYRSISVCECEVFVYVRVRARVG